MKLQVQVMEARGLAARDSNGFSDPFVRLSLGNTKARSSVQYKTLNPSWNEDFFFTVADLDEELSIMVWDQDRFTDDFLGQVRIPVFKVLNADKQTLLRAWYPLQKRSEKSKHAVTGEILLSLSLYGREDSAKINSSSIVRTLANMEDSPSVASIPEDATLSRSSSMESLSSTDGSNLVDPPISPSMQRRHRKNRKWKDVEKVASRISSVFKKPKHGVESTSLSASSRLSDRSSDVLILSEASEGSSDDEADLVPLAYFDDDGLSVEASPEDIPAPLAGGVVLDQMYAVSHKALNRIIFTPASEFMQDVVMAQRSTEYTEDPWKIVEGGPMKRVLTYVKGATRLVKAVKATEVQTYTRADDKCFVVTVSCATPDVPYGGNFLVELQITIAACKELPNGEKNCRLEISWRVNFLHNTMMKGMIESGARQGIKESYDIFREILSKFARPISGDLISKAALAAVQEDESPISDWALAWDYFGKYSVLLAILTVLFVVVHIWCSPPHQKGGLEFWGLDLPDSFTELITAAVVVLQVERVAKMIYQFVRARFWQSGDHGVKARGDGWLTTVTLIEGENLTPSESSDFSNPYVVFTCNGKTRTSSVKLRTLNPHWRELFEFDATEDPPSTMDVEVFDYDGPFAEAESLGHAEINFLKQSPADLSDFWLSLAGKNARAHGSRLHLRVFLTNTRETDALPEYLERVEREVGTKVMKQSAQRNATFQKMFSLPAEEFLINDFACAIKRKIPIQGRVFLSPRLLGFYSNLFGHKTKFTLLWEDIEEIKETVAQAINPSLVILLRKGRGHDARHGARGIDGRGRLKFQFLSFVRPGSAFRTVIALWKNRNLSPEQQVEIVASMQAGEMKYAVAEKQADDTERFLGVEEANMSEVVVAEIPLTAEAVLILYEKENMDEVVNEKLGLINYKATPWEHVQDRPAVDRRQLSYSLNHHLSQFGTKVSCSQQKTVFEDLRKVVVDELLTLHDVPFGDHFQVQVRREIETLSTDPASSQVKAFVGVAWHKSTEFQKKITKNVYKHMTKQLREVMDIIVHEISAVKEDKKFT